jgi:hypothetical protein
MGPGTRQFQTHAERASCPNPAGDGSRQVNVAGIACGLVQRASSIQSTLSTFDTLALIHFLLTIIVFQYLRCAARFGTAFALETEATLRINCGLVMWKITTRGFTLEEVLIMAAMNLLASADIAQHKKPASQQLKGDRTWS